MFCFHAFTIMRLNCLGSQVLQSVKPEKKLGLLPKAYVTGPAIIGHVGTDYTLSHNGSYLSDEVEYLHSITCIIRPIKCIKDAETFMAIP